MHSERGFTLVEVMVAAFVVAIGLFGALGMLDLAAREATGVKARASAVALQREVVETARSIPYDQLNPGSVVEKVQSQPGLGDSTVGTEGWTIRRRGVTYTVSVGACSVDQASDGTGAHDPSSFCPTTIARASNAECRRLFEQLAAGGTLSASDPVAGCGIDANRDGRVDRLTEAEQGVSGSTGTDRTPDDLKWIISSVYWKRGGRVHFAVQNATLTNPGGAAGPAVTQLTRGDAIDPISFTATTSRTPAAVSWTVDGKTMGTASGTGTTWAFTWDTTTVADGTYLVTARAVDAYGLSGSTRTETVKLNRHLPTAPKGFAAGRNGSVVELEWTRSPEGDLEGYRGYRVSSSGTRTLVCGLADRTSCQDTSPPGDASLTYELVAVDRDPATGALREGAASTRTVTTDNRPPNAPTDLQASWSSGNAVLIWRAPDPADPDTGDAIDFYRIYRNGTAYADRYARTGSGTELTFTDIRADGERHTYWVTAVDRQLAESPLSNSATPPAP